ncbi:hypothetical protein CFC21_007543 [Triticum aestivum]|uniref:Uncharacterized protein n=2 Tax=Triticum aestivum TaxID=4565 RepID=A0A3B5Z0U3_WHEAT|nr:hypothetical protein CFC21_007543 [Triticum aestivum]
MGEAVEAPAASSTTVEMEAAEQLIQLSGGGCDDGDSGESESKSADSVRAGEKVLAVERKSVKAAGEKVPAVASKSAGSVKAAGEKARAAESKSADSVKAGEKRGDGKEGVPAVESSTGKRREKLGGHKGGGQDEEAVIGGVARRRPRFRSLASIYKNTRRMDDHGHRREEAEEDERSEGKGKKNNKRKRATDGAADGELIPTAVPCKAKRGVRRRTS